MSFMSTVFISALSVDQRTHAVEDKVKGYKETAMNQDMLHHRF